MGNEQDRLSSSPSDSTTGDIQNGFVPSSSGASDTGDTIDSSKQVDFTLDSNAQQHSTQQQEDSTDTPVSLRKLNEALTETLEKNSANHRNSDSCGGSSTANSEIPTEASVDSGMASLHDVNLASNTTDTDSKQQGPLNANTNFRHSDRTLTYTDSKSSLGKASLTKSASSTTSSVNSAAMSDSYMAGECTIMELLKEEYKNSQKGGGVSSDNEGDTPRRRGVGLGLKGSLGVGKAVPVTSASSSSRTTAGPGNNGAVAKPRQLVSPVADKTIEYLLIRSISGTHIC